MLNREKYAKEILDIACKGDKIAVRNGKMTSCDNLLCKDCDFGYSDCNEKILKWANSEYVEPPVDWSKVAVDTPILVKDVKSGEWNRGYFAMYENGTVFTWYHGATSWSAEGESDIASWKFAKLAESEE
jgi:hypothetical protein